MPKTSSGADDSITSITKVATDNELLVHTASSLIVYTKQSAPLLFEKSVYVLMQLAVWMVFVTALNLSQVARAFSARSSSRLSPRFCRYKSTMSAVNGVSGEYPTEMTEDERYLFDLNGYLIIRGVLTPEEVEEANAMINKHSDEMVQRSDQALRNAVEGTKLYGSGPGRKDLGQVLEWGRDSKIFKSILAHPRLVPL